MRELIRRALLKEGYIPRCASTGKEALSLAKGCSLVLLDIVLPDVHGLSLCAEFKHLTGGEIMVISSLTREEEVVAGLDVGVDDYIRKPFAMKELLSRVRASLRRRGIFLSREFQSDASSLTFIKKEGKTELTKQEYQLLQFFLRHPGKIIPKQVLMKEIWGWIYTQGNSRSVDMAVARLRKKTGLSSDGSPYIETIRGKGYLFREER
ncbi:MAG TPA: hypothetical protein DCY74_00175 [Clostridiales bacterium]|nr:hypothetical protein [Clostridiales bacterium]